MAAPSPRAPDSLHPLSRELPETLAGHDEAAEIVIGGGVALGHYLDYRTTVDLDARWQTAPREDVLALLEATRPLESIEPAEAREQAGRVRKWFYGTFAAAAP